MATVEDLTSQLERAESHVRHLRKRIAGLAATARSPHMTTGERVEATRVVVAGALNAYRDGDVDAVNRLFSHAVHVGCTPAELLAEIIAAQEAQEPEEPVKAAVKKAAARKTAG